MDRADVIVVGAGIVGLATVYALVERDPRLRIVVLEKMPRPAMHQSGRNSGVLHSGIYYKPGSLKARLCVTGRAEMVEFCRRHGVTYEVCGKVIVATDAREVAALPGLRDRAAQNGVRAELIGVERLRELEPNASGLAALHVPETGIADYPAVCDALVRLLAERGTELRCGTAVERLHERPEGIRAFTTAGEVEARVVVTCAGLHSDRLARGVGGRPDVRIVPFRGEFYELAPERSGLVRNLIYPVPDPQFPFLGVHLTRAVHGGVHAGPNAVLALAREGYRWRDVRAGETVTLLAWRGFWNLARRHWRKGAAEVWRSLNKRAFTAALQRLVPAVRAEDLQPAASGVRAQAMDASGAMLDDFAFAESSRSVHVINAPSPAATASLPIGRLIAERVVARL
jgi:L-2-hydroxyglutarate oxidase